LEQQMAKLMGFWNHDRRVFVYERLVEQFGAFAEWGGARYPLDRREEYNQALEQIAGALAAESGREVLASKLENQIQWAIGAQRLRSQLAHDSHWGNLSRNKTAALQANLITPADMPIDDLPEQDE
jgi:hypothetical protein